MLPVAHAKPAWSHLLIHHKFPAWATVIAGSPKSLPPGVKKCHRPIKPVWADIAFLTSTRVNSKATSMRMTSGPGSQAAWQGPGRVLRVSYASIPIRLAPRTHAYGEGTYRPGPKHVRLISSIPPSRYREEVSPSLSFPAKAKGRPLLSSC